MSSDHRVLIVGAGAVGVAYGDALQRAGAALSFYVKPKHREALAEGIPVHRLNRGRGLRRLEGFGILSELDELSDARFDEVWLAMSSTALRQPWFDPFAERIGDATLVALQPGLSNEAWIAERVPPERTVWGLIALISWQTPLPGEALPEGAPPGIAVYYPPLSPSPFSDKGSGAARGIVARLRAGGCPAKVSAEVGSAAALPSAILMTQIAALEGAGWSFSRARREGWWSRGARAAREALSISGAVSGRRPWMRGLVRGPALSLASRLAPSLVPFDLERYLAYHFTKVGDQTRAAIAELIAAGQARGLPTEALEALRAEAFTGEASGSA